MSSSEKINHQAFMARALFLASQGVGFTSPNPMVGAVIVRDGNIIGEGWHRKAGGPHAEIEALRSAKGPVAGATMYVTLEPCCHFGRTPPCSQAVIDADIAEVFYAVGDSNPKVAGGGHAQMVAAGIKVHQGPLTHEATSLNRAFFHFIETKTPFVIAKFAMSLDGCIATHTGASKWITNPASRQVGMELRHFCDGILVGSGTITADRPRLTTRQLSEKSPCLSAALYPLKELLRRFPEIQKPSVFHQGSPVFAPPSQSPQRVVLDSQAGLEPHDRLFDAQRPGNTLLFTSRSLDSESREAFNRLGVALVGVEPDNKGRIKLEDILAECGRRDMVSLLVEGGSTVHGSFFTQGLVDEVWAFVAPKIIGGKDAPSPVGGNGAVTMQDCLDLEWISKDFLESDILLRARPKSH